MRKLEITEVQNELLVLMKKLHKFLGEHNLPYYLLGGSALGAVRHNGFIPWDDDIDIGLLRETYEEFLTVCKDFDSEYDIVNFKNASNCDFILTRVFINNTMIDKTTTKQAKLDRRLHIDIFPIDKLPVTDEECTKYEKNIKRYKVMLEYCDVRDYGNGSAQVMVKKAIAAILSPFRATIIKKCDKLMKKYRNIETPYLCSLCSQYSFEKQKMPYEFYGTPVLHKFEDCELYIPERTSDYLTTLFGANHMEIPPESERRKGFDIYKLD